MKKFLLIILALTLSQAARAQSLEQNFDRLACTLVRFGESTLPHGTTLQLQPYSTRTELVAKVFLITPNYSQNYFAFKHSSHGGDYAEVHLNLGRYVSGPDQDAWLTLSSAPPLYCGRGACDPGTKPVLSAVLTIDRNESYFRCTF